MNTLRKIQIKIRKKTVIPELILLHPDKENI